MTCQSNWLWRIRFAGVRRHLVAVFELFGNSERCGFESEALEPQLQTVSWRQLIKQTMSRVASAEELRYSESDCDIQPSSPKFFPLKAIPQATRQNAIVAILA